MNWAEQSASSSGSGMDSAAAQVLITRKRGELEYLMHLNGTTANAEENPPFLKALAEVRRIGVHEGWRYHHVQAIILSIDQYAEAATGNRQFFWNKPHSIGPTSKGDVP